MGLSGLARSEGVSEKRERLKSERHKEGNKREREKRETEIVFAFLFPLWAMGRAI